MKSSPAAVLIALVVAAPLAGLAEERVIDRAAVRGTKTCAVLSAAQVAAAAKVPPSAVSENPKVKCLFSWKDGTAFASVNVHRSSRAARRHFAGLTEQTTAAQMRAGKQQVQEELRKKAAEGELTRGQAAAGGAVVERMPKQDGAAQGISGVGDEAALGADGKVTVRLGNVTFQLAARSGGKDEGDPELSRALARQVAGNLERL